jgi:hypothetical protein
MPAAPLARCDGCTQVVAPGGEIVVGTRWEGICEGHERRSWESGNLFKPTFPCEQHPFTVDVECGGCTWKVEYFEASHSDGMVRIRVPDRLGPFAFTLRMKSGDDEHGWQSPQFSVEAPTAPFDPVLTGR